MDTASRPSKQAAALHCALLHENEARRDEYLAQIMERAMLEYRGTIPLRIAHPSTLRTWAKHARQESERFLHEALALSE